MVTGSFYTWWVYKKLHFLFQALRHQKKQKWHNSEHFAHWCRHGKKVGTGQERNVCLYSFTLIYIRNSDWHNSDLQLTQQYLHPLNKHKEKVIHHLLITHYVTKMLHEFPCFLNRLNSNMYPHPLAALPWGKEPSAPTGKEVVLASRPVWMQWQRDVSPPLSVINSNFSSHPDCSLVTYTE